MPRLLKLENRSVIRLTGPDGRSLLQGLVTNDVEKLNDTTAVYAGLLTPQGKFLFDMIIVVDGDDLLLDVEADRKADLIRRLMMYKLRADVEIIDEPSFVWALLDGDADQGVTYNDPRHKSLHKRIICAESPAPDAAPLAFSDYEERRIRRAVPDGSRDMAVEKYFWLETNAEEINGVSFTKGCFVGQELTARMKHRMALKKKLVPLKVVGEANSGDAIVTAEGKSAGEIRSTANGFALAYFRLEHSGADLSVNGHAVSLLLKAN